MTDLGSLVRVEELGAVTHVVMGRSPANALGPPLLEGLERALDAFLAREDARALVISSAVPSFFAAGADLKYISTLDAAGFRRYRDDLRSPIERLAACGRPSIAAIDGLALGGGLELAMACTLRFATPESRLGLPEVKLGLIPGAGGTQRLPPLVGAGRALKLMLSGGELDGRQAAAIGLVDQLVGDGDGGGDRHGDGDGGGDRHGDAGGDEEEDVVEVALAFASVLARRPAAAIASIIACVQAAVLTPASGMRFEGEQVASLFAGGHADAGIAAFLQKASNPRP